METSYYSNFSSLVPHLQPGWVSQAEDSLMYKSENCKWGNLMGVARILYFLFLLVCNFLRHINVDSTFETWKNVRASSICVCYLYLSVCLIVFCLIVFCLITQVKQFVSIRRGKNYNQKTEH